MIQISGMTSYYKYQSLKSQNYVHVWIVLNDKSKCHHTYIDYRSLSFSSNQRKCTIQCTLMYMKHYQCWRSWLGVVVLMYMCTQQLNAKRKALIHNKQQVLPYESVPTSSLDNKLRNLTIISYLILLLPNVIYLHVLQCSDSKSACFSPRRYFRIIGINNLITKLMK